MSEPWPQSMSDEITRKWHALAERRRAHFIELYDSGRWKRYYSEGDFVAQMRETVKLADTWARLSNEPPPVVAEAAE
jgi:uncharacterized repeat protein (TIGR03809 family)